MNSASSPKRVLVVAYLFPPVGGAGVQRVAKFVKYLPDFGWNATVLTAENPSVPVFDESLLADIPPSTRIVKARTLEPGYALKRIVSASREASKASSPHEPVSVPKTDDAPSLARRALAAAKSLARTAANFVLQPDPQILWHHHAVNAGLRALAEQPHDAIFVTAPPFSSLLVGAELSRRTGLPLVLDYRDEWDISNAYWENKRQSTWSRWWQSRQQRGVVQAASALIATTQHSAEALSRVAHSAGSKSIVTHIYNGFDAADFEPVNAATSCQLAAESPQADTNSDPYKLAYVGTLWNLTSVEPLVRAVQWLAEQSPELTARLELHFAGRRTATQDELLRQLDATPCRIVRHPYVDHDAALRLMQSSDGLCLLLSDVPHAGRVVPAKLFEYLAARRPILSIAPRGEVTDLLSDCPLGFAHLPSDIAGIARRLGDEIERKRLGVTLEPGLWNAERFERRQLTRELADLLNQVAPARNSDFGSRAVDSVRRHSSAALLECHP